MEDLMISIILRAVVIATDEREFEWKQQEWWLVVHYTWNHFHWNLSITL